MVEDLMVHEGNGPGRTPLPGSVRLGQAVCAIVVVVLPAAALFYGALVRYTYRCDEACDVTAGWTRSHSGWEWAVQFWCFAVPGAIAATLVVCFLALGQPRKAGVALAVSVASLLAYGLFPALTGG